METKTVVLTNLSCEISHKLELRKRIDKKQITEKANIYDDIIIILQNLQYSEDYLNLFLEKFINDIVVLNSDLHCKDHDFFENLFKIVECLLIIFERFTNNIKLIENILIIINHIFDQFRDEHIKKIDIFLIYKILPIKFYMDYYNLNIIQNFFKLMDKLIPVKSDTNILSNLQNLLLCLALRPDPRIRKFVLFTLLAYHLKYGYMVRLPLIIYDLVCVTLQDDNANIRLLSLILLHQVGIFYPSRIVVEKTRHDPCLLKLRFNEHFQSAILELNGVSGNFQKNFEDDSEIAAPREEKGTINEPSYKNNDRNKDAIINIVFKELCKMVINDISPEVRALSAYLLSFPYQVNEVTEINTIAWLDLSSDKNSLNSNYFGKLLRICDFHNVHTSEEASAGPSNNMRSKKCLWPLTNVTLEGVEVDSARDIINQTLDKRVLVSNMRRKQSYHERTQQGLAGGQAKPVSDRPLEVVGDENVISADAGAFVHGLEDESSLVRKLTIESMCILALRVTADTTQLKRDFTSPPNSNPLTFAYKTVEYLVDMFNDEIMEVRLIAILGLGCILTFVADRVFESHLGIQANIISSHGFGLTFRNDQIEFVLSALEDASQDIRNALRLIIRNCRVTEMSSVLLIVRFLLQNMIKYTEDYLSVYECFRDFGRNHSDLILPQIPDLLCFQSPYDARRRMFTGYVTEKSSFPFTKTGKLSLESDLKLFEELKKSREDEQTVCIDFQFDPMEPDVTEDKAYVAVLTLILNALLVSKREDSSFYYSILPSYVMERHYVYLRDTFPNLFKRPRYHQTNLASTGTKANLLTSKSNIIDYLRDDVILSKFTSVTADRNAEYPFEQLYQPLVRSCQALSHLIGRKGYASFATSFDNNASTETEMFESKVKHFAQSCANFLAFYVKLRYGVYRCFRYLILKSRQPKSHAEEFITPEHHKNFEKIKHLLYRVTYCFYGIPPAILKNLQFFGSVLFEYWKVVIDTPKKRKLMEFDDLDGEIIPLKKKFKKFLSSPTLIDEDCKDTVYKDLHPILQIDSNIVFQYFLDNQAITRELLALIDSYHQGETVNLFHQIEANIVTPIENKDKESARKFIAGLTLKIPIECHLTSTLLPQVNSASMKQKPGENGMNTSNTLADMFKIMIKYPDNRVQICDIPQNDFKSIWMGASDGIESIIKIDSNVYATSEKPWTDSGIIEISPILKIDKDILGPSSHSNIKDVLSTPATAIIEFKRVSSTNQQLTPQILPLGSPVKIYIFPRSLQGR